MCAYVLTQFVLSWLSALEMVFILFILNGTYKKISLALSLVLALNNLMNAISFSVTPLNLYMRKVKQINIKNRTYYFYNDMINLKNFDSNLLKIDKKHYKGINVKYIGYITIKKIGDCENIYSVNPLYLFVNHANGYLEEKNGNKDIIFDQSVNENKTLLKNTQMFEMELQTKSKQ